jgi:pSer/pThr/pTyr-binding forkhead associated (FHA) protein
MRNRLKPIHAPNLRWVRQFPAGKAGGGAPWAIAFLTNAEICPEFPLQPFFELCLGQAISPREQKSRPRHATLLARGKDTMPTRRNNTVNQPVLIPIAGNYDKKPRALDREVTTVGRARGTDLCLEANEISTLHCVIYRTAEGYRIRDCNSRCGTRINGESIKSAFLHDCDIVNMGPFSFEFRLPAELFPGEGKVDPAKIEHWKASRRRLAAHALKFRKHLKAGTRGEQEYAQKGHVLKDKIRCYDQRLGELEAAEDELAQDRKKLAQEAEKHLQHVAKVEEEIARRLQQADEEIHDKWLQFQQRCQAEQAELQAPKPSESGHDDLGQRLQETRDQSQRLHQVEEQLNRRHAQWQREQQEFNNMKEQWAQDQAKASATLDDQMATLARQKSELVRMMGDLKKMQEDLRKHAKADTNALQKDIARLERENAELRRQQEQSVPADLNRQLDDLQAEIALLNEDLQNKEQALQHLENGRGHGHGDAALRAENELLKKLLEEKNQALNEFTQKSNEIPKSEGDLERYEAELNEFRRQLEDDRVKLNTEVETLRERNRELDDAIREMEMEMSKERAELARERMRLERVREEVKADSERLQREQSVRDSMAPVQKLRDELTGKQPPPAKSDKPAKERPRTMRG